MNYSELRNIQKKERESAALVQLSEDFYGELSNFLDSKRKDAMESRSLLKMREYENLKRIISSIKTKREEKIVLMAVRGEKSTAGLTAEEESLLGELSRVLDKSRKGFLTEEKEDSQKEKVIKILSDVERYKGADNQQYGPFREGEEVTLPEKEIEWLLKSNLAEVVKG